MNLYTHTKVEINFVKLNKELELSSFKSEISFYECDEVFRLVTSEPLNLDKQLEFKAMLDNHNPEYMAGTIKEIVDKAIEYGHNLLVGFSTANVLQGITQAGLTEAVLDYMSPIKMAIDSGSLYVVIAKLDKLIFEGVPANLSPFVTTERLEEIKTEIETYLAG